MKNIGKPCEVALHARFDEGELGMASGAQRLGDT